MMAANGKNMSLSTPTTTDYLSMLQSFASNEFASEMSESPLIDLAVLPSPIRLPTMPQIDTYSQNHQRSSDQFTGAHECSETANVKQEELLSDITPVYLRPTEVKQEQELEDSDMNELMSDHVSYTDESDVHDQDDSDYDDGDNDNNGGGSNQSNTINVVPISESQTRYLKKEDIRDGDVISHRGIAQSQHTGNVRFRELVNAYKATYDARVCPDIRHALAKNIVDQIQPGRFLKLDGAGAYRVFDRKAAETKALFAMRDCKRPRGKITILSDADIASLSSGATTFSIKLECSPKMKKTNIRKGRSIKKKSKQIVKRKQSITKHEQPAQTVSQKSPRSQPRRKTVTPPKELPRFVTSREIRSIKYLIEQTVNKKRQVKSNSNYPATRSEEIHAFIERMVEKGAEARKNAESSLFDEEWFHPEMQKCIRLQILQRCKIAMETTGMTHNEFFKRLFLLKLFP